LRRLDHLRPETVELLRAASVLGRTFDLAVVADVVGRRGISVAADVDEALAAGEDTREVWRAVCAHAAVPSDLT